MAPGGNPGDHAVQGTGRTVALSMFLHREHSALRGVRGGGAFKHEPHKEESTVEFLMPQQRPGEEFKPVNVMFCGRRGKGKTMAQAGLAKRHSRNFVRLGLPWKVISNHWLAFADYNSPFLLEEVWQQDPHMAHNSLVCIDEITAAAVSRRPTARTNVDAGRWIEQVRKFPAEVTCTTQFPTEVDRYFTRQIDIFVMCEARIGRYARVNPVVAARAYIDLYVFDLWGQWTGRYDIPKLGWPPPLWRADDLIRIGNLPSFWNDYRSQEVIPTLWGSEAYRDRVLEREGWKPVEDGAGAEGELEAQVTSDLAQMDREGTHPPVSGVLDMAPKDLVDWLADRSAGNQDFVLTNGLFQEVRRLEPSIMTKDDLRRHLEPLGYALERVGKSDTVRRT